MGSTDEARASAEAGTAGERRSGHLTGLDIFRVPDPPASTRSGRQWEAFIYEAILRAFVTGRLPPGTRLPEQQLAEIFGVSRERVRKTLHRLAHERWLELAPGRGATVPRLRMEDAREILQARVILETGILDQLLTEPRLIDADALCRHLAEEQKAERQGTAVELTRLTAKFHFILAGWLRNEWIARHVEELVLRSLVFVVLYGRPVGPGFCGPQEHRDVARHLLAGERDRAHAAMVDHISGMGLFLDFRTERKLSSSLSEVLSVPQRT